LVICLKGERIDLRIMNSGLTYYALCLTLHGHERSSAHGSIENV
jgi:hypothetical protein